MRKGIHMRNKLNELLKENKKRKGRGEKGKVEEGKIPEQ